MSSDKAENRRRKVAQLRQAELARAKRRRTAAVALSAVVVLAAVVGIGIAVQANRSPSTTAGSTAVPAHLTDGGILLGATAPVTVTVYEDFQCPVCKNFEETTGPTLDELQKAGKVQVLDKPVAILDRGSKDEYSTRSLNAAACVIDANPAAYPAFKSALFAQQPEEGGSGLTDAQLTSIAEQAGAPGLSDCITSRRFERWTARTTDQASKDGLTGTPYVLVNGKALENPTPVRLESAVAAARP